MSALRDPIVTAKVILSFSERSIARDTLDMIPQIWYPRCDTLDMTP